VAVLLVGLLDLQAGIGWVMVAVVEVMALVAGAVLMPILGGTLVVVEEVVVAW
jgi:hypothetical protein